MEARTAVLLGLGLAAIAVATVTLGSPTADVSGVDEPTDGPDAVRILDADGDTLATVSVTVADTSPERRTGLSDHASLENGTGMWFVFDREAGRTFHMRGMNFSIDMLFVGSDGRIIRIHHADVSDADARYRGRAKWVLEVNAGFAERNGIEMGDRVRPVDRTPRR